MVALPAAATPRWATFLLLLLSANLVAITLLLWFREPVVPAVPVETPRLTLFERAIDDAAKSAPERISRRLFALSPSNPRLQWQRDDAGAWVKVAAWMNEDSFERYYRDRIGNPAGARTPADQPRLWVTLVPEVQTFCRRLANDAQYSPAFRLKQFLGLNPNRRYTRFVELWVQPEDLFRPCPDPQTGDTACDLAFDPSNPPRVRGVADYPAFFAGLEVQSYAPGGAPWTRLGYTYDWAFGEWGVGASEYLLVPDAPYRVDGAYSTDAYCQRP